MKIKVIFLSCLIGLIVLSIGYEGSLAKSESQAKAEKPSVKIGVVSIRKIFQDCKKSVSYREEAIAEKNRIEADLDRISKEIGAEQAGLRTLKPDSSDYAARVKEMLQKQAGYKPLQEFYQQQLALKNHRVIQSIYGDILRVTGEIAKQKGLDLVLEKSEPELPIANPGELEFTIGRHKVLYSGGCLDITDEVIARLDAEQ